MFDADYDKILVPVNTGGAHQIITCKERPPSLGEHPKQARTHEVLYTETQKDYTRY